MAAIAEVYAACVIIIMTRSIQMGTPLKHVVLAKLQC